MTQASGVVARLPIPVLWIGWHESEVPMSWEVNDREFESVLALPPQTRYEYFIKRSASHGELWGLHGVQGWVIAEDDHGEKHFPIWPHRRFAQACSSGPWAAESPRSIDIDEWVEAWTPQLERDGLRIAVFQTPEDEGIGVSVERLKRDLEAELSLFGGH
jgi:hypothetical protein